MCCPYSCCSLPSSNEVICTCVLCYQTSGTSSKEKSNWNHIGCGLVGCTFSSDQNQCTLIHREHSIQVQFMWNWFGSPMWTCAYLPWAVILGPTGSGSKVSMLVDLIWAYLEQCQVIRTLLSVESLYAAWIQGLIYVYMYNSVCVFVINFLRCF